MWAMEYNPNIYSSYDDRRQPLLSELLYDDKPNDKHKLKEYGKFERNNLKTGAAEQNSALAVFLVRRLRIQQRFKNSSTSVETREDEYEMPDIPSTIPFLPNMCLVGWEKSENEVAVLKQQLEAAEQQNLTLDVHVNHLDVCEG
ncbi:uncharacterized protein LOC132635669 [Lycium barbarum]|uniref:uncharacterized protein LOC132635669 n=1 Tax=Lycium barbarum TaxID=112863 RepID=UPI00293EA57F|nr:uncharacterized protein LOC132635669 [Lycium barbarum]